MKVLILLLLLTGSAFAQFTPTPRAAYIFSGGVWSPLAGTGAAIGPPNPVPIALYVRSGSTWVAWDGAGGGGGGGVTSINSTAGAFTFSGPGVSCTTTTCTFAGGGATIPSVTNLISGSGTGNGADSGIVPANVAILSGTQTFSGTKTFNSVKVASTTVSTFAAPAFLITDSETAQATTVGQSIIAPNLAATNTLYSIFGRDGTVTRNSGYFGFNYQSSGASSNNLVMGLTGSSPNMTLFGTGNVGVGSADNGFKLDVTGTFRATTSITTPQIATSGTTQGVNLFGVGTGTISTTGWPTNYVGVVGPASGTPTYLLQLPATAPAGGQLMSCATPGTVNGVNQSVCTWASPVLSAVLTVAVANAATQNLTVTGATTNSRCTFSPSSATAATNLGGVYVSGVTANTVTLTFGATSQTSDLYNVICTNNI